MKGFEMLSDDELYKIYEEAKARTAITFAYAQKYLKTAQAQAEESYAKAMEKYHKDYEEYEKRYQQSYEQWQRNEEARKKAEESMYNVKLQYWESMKKSKESQGIAVDESTRPVKKEFVPGKFQSFWFAPQMPKKADMSRIGTADCNYIIMSFREFYDKSRSSFKTSNIIEMISSVMSAEDYVSEFFEKELRKESRVTEENRRKLEYLTLREHYIRMREDMCCTVAEMQSYDPVVNGVYGEKLTVFELELMKMKKYKGNILHDLYIPAANGKYVQVDIAFVTSKGIIVIESKNYSGNIIGNEADDNWYIEKRNSKKPFYSPVKQNREHIEAIDYHLKGIPCFSLIAFSERCHLKQIKVSSSTAYVFNRYAMLNVFSRIFNTYPDVLSDEVIKHITNELRKYCDADDNVRRAHNDNIRDNVTHDYNSFETFDNYDDYM